MLESSCSTSSSSFRRTSNRVPEAARSTLLRWDTTRLPIPKARNPNGPESLGLPPSRSGQALLQHEPRNAAFPTVDAGFPQGPIGSKLNGCPVQASAPPRLQPGIQALHDSESLRGRRHSVPTVSRLTTLHGKSQPSIHRPSIPFAIPTFVRGLHSKELPSAGCLESLRQLRAGLGATLDPKPERAILPWPATTWHLLFSSTPTSLPKGRRQTPISQPNSSVRATG